jgi:hypothetical protein
MIATVIYQIDSTTKTMVVNGPNISVQITSSGSGVIEVSDENRKIVRSILYGRLEMVDVDRTSAHT